MKALIIMPFLMVSGLVAKEGSDATTMEFRNVKPERPEFRAVLTQVSDQQWPGTIELTFSVVQSISIGKTLVSIDGEMAFVYGELGAHADGTKLTRKLKPTGKLEKYRTALGTTSTVRTHLYRPEMTAADLVQSLKNGAEYRVIFGESSDGEPKTVVVKW